VSVIARDKSVVCSREMNREKEVDNKEEEECSSQTAVISSK
jgi:hypothetical protein